MIDENWHQLFQSLIEAEKTIPVNTLRGAYIGDKKICIVNNQHTFYAVSDLCPHQRASLSKGFLNSFGEIICPLHQYRFNLKSGQESDNRSDFLERYTIRVDDEGVFVRL
jgi:3-phenylpropionate/trans-cinnamate dioxygenase ferredoxin subunit